MIFMQGFLEIMAVLFTEVDVSIMQQNHGIPAVVCTSEWRSVGIKYRSSAAIKPKYAVRAKDCSGRATCLGLLL